MKRGTRHVIRDLDVAGSRAAMQAHNLRRALDISHADAEDAASFVTTHPE
jgi:hypothetical protein